MATVLILDGWSRAAVECVQSLGRRGVEVHAAGSPDCAAFRSRRATRRYVQPSAADSERFLAWLRELDRRHGYALIVPCTEASLLPLADLPTDDSVRGKAVLSPQQSLEACLDKTRTLALAQSLGVAAPDTSVIHDARQDPLLRDYPHVLKPARSLVRHGRNLEQLKPVLVNNAETRGLELARLLARAAVLEQEVVPGSGYGIEVLYRQGELVWYFAHERLHEGSGTGLGSGSLYRRSVEPQREILDEAVGMLDALRWHGAAMVEFRRTKDGLHWLMEVNPRLWGSLALAIDAGVDFPYGLYCLATGRRVPPQPAYRRHYHTRVMFEDLDWLRRQPGGRSPSRTFRELLFLFRPVVFRESWDHFDWRDLGVLRRNAALFVGSTFQGVRRKCAASLRQQEVRRMHHRNLARFQGSVRPPTRLLFVCRGNICRSPVAEALARAHLPALSVSSAGFVPTEGRPVPGNIQAMAAMHEVDLIAHASRRLTEEIAAAAEMILLFDVRNYSEFKSSFPHHLDKVLMLGLFRRDPQLSIEDPYGQPEAAAATVVDEIAASVARLAAFVSRAVPASYRKSLSGSRD